jgi:hypothetical protein
MYGSENTITVKIPYPEKTVIVRLPTNEELAKFYDSGAKNKDPENRDAEVALFQSVHVKGIDDDKDAIDEYEATYIINNLLWVKSESEKEGNNYKITLTTPFGECIHSMQPMTIKQHVKATSVMSKQNEKATREAFVKLYDELILKSPEGYADGTEIPVHHKRIAVALINSDIYAFDPIVKNA